VKLIVGDGNGHATIRRRRREMIGRIIRIDEQGISAPPGPLRRENLQVDTLAAAAPPVAVGSMKARARVIVTTPLK
jgi:uncharacterized protein YggE